MMWPASRAQRARRGRQNHARHGYRRSARLLVRPLEGRTLLGSNLWQAAGAPVGRV
jgi:hypothetical protein